MALDNPNNWSPLPYTFDLNSKEGANDKYVGILLLKGNDEKEYLFKLDIKEEVPVDKKGKPTISQQDITRKKGILYKVSVDSIENSGVSISTNCVSTNLTQIVSSLVVELSLDIESRYNPLEEKNSVSLFVDLARMRALEKLN